MRINNTLILIGYLAVALQTSAFAKTQTTVIHICGDNPTTQCVPLTQINNNLAGSYILDEDLTLPTGGTFQPIGNEDTPFTGTFDGNNHTIYNLDIAQTLAAQNTGLFGHTNNATIKNITLVNPQIKAGTDVGALAGSIDNTTIINASAENAFINAYYNVGGLIGNSYGKSSITNSYSTGKLVARFDPTPQKYSETYGGLVGGNYYDATISQSYSSVSIVAGDELGGLVGYNEGHINNSYSTGRVMDTGRAEGPYMGGLVGINFEDGTIDNCYSTGLVVDIDKLPHEMDSVGGLIGAMYANMPNINNSFWNINTSGQVNGMGNIIIPSWNKTYGRTSQEMMQQDLYSQTPNWDFDKVWAINPGVSFPYLKSIYQHTPIVISGFAQSQGTNDDTPHGTAVEIIANNKDRTVYQNTLQTGANNFYYDTINSSLISSPTPLLLHYANSYNNIYHKGSSISYLTENSSNQWLANQFNLYNDSISLYAPNNSYLPINNALLKTALIKLPTISNILYHFANDALIIPGDNFSPTLNIFATSQGRVELNGSIHDKTKAPYFTVHIRNKSQVTPVPQANSYSINGQDIWKLQ